MFDIIWGTIHLWYSRLFLIIGIYSLFNGVSIGKIFCCFLGLMINFVAKASINEYLGKMEATREGTELLLSTDKNPIKKYIRWLHRRFLLKQDARERKDKRKILLKIQKNNGRIKKIQKKLEMIDFDFELGDSRLLLNSAVNSLEETRKNLEHIIDDTKK